MKTKRPAMRCGFLFLASLALALGPARGKAQEPSTPTQGGAVISSVAITQVSERASVRVEGEGLLEPRATRMQAPDRLVLDFAGTRLAVHRTALPGVSAPIKGVRLSQFKPDVVRVVVDLTGEARFQISQEASGVVVWFQTASAGAASEKPANTKAEKGSRLGTSSKAAQQAGAEIPRFELPRELTQPSVSLASFGGKSPLPERPAQQAGGGNGGGQQPPATPAAEKYSGAPLSVNLKDVDLRDFFRLIHEISGLNVVLDPAVKGSLTIVLDEVPWDQALDIVLANNGLDKQLNGNVLRIATHETLRKEAETQRDLQKAQAEAIAPVTVTRVLNYAKAAALVTPLRKFLSSRGEILADDRSNQLIIRDIPATIPNIDNLIRQLDRKSQQVEIEARVVAASRAFAQDIGVQLGFASSATNGRNLFGGDSTVGTSNFGGTVIPPPIVVASTTPPALPLAVNLGANAPTSGVLFSHRSPNFALDFFLTAAESKGVGKVLSKPKLVTQNNEKATVKQGTKIPVQTTINNTISVQFIDAVLQLQVTPQITGDGTVYMDVLVENTAIDQGIPRVQGIPALDTQSVETKLTVADGGTVVIGGVIVNNQTINYNEVPVVGSLPLIGHLFKRQTVSNTSQELLFFLTPRITPG